MELGNGVAVAQIAALFYSLSHLAVHDFFHAYRNVWRLGVLGEIGSERRHVMSAYPRERFGSEIRLTPETVAAYAGAVGDTNPVHHDADYAATTRYERVIASGTHTTALLLAATAAHYSKSGAMVGLEFWVRFRRPIYADETIRMEWLVVRVTPNAKLGGDIVELRGRIQGADGKTALGAKGKILVTARL